MMRLFIIGTLILFLGSCLNPPEYSPIPEIEFDSISSTFAVANQDSITFFITFTDGDGDLGSDEIPNLFFKDNRTLYTDSFKIPDITPDGNVKAISGRISYTFFPFNCIPGKDFDSLFFTIYVADRAGNNSNEVISPMITLQCD